MSYPPPRKRGLFVGMGIGGIALVATVVAVVLVVTSGATTPRDVARSYVDAATRYDVDALKETSCVDDKQFVDDNSDHLEAFAGSEGEDTEVSVGDAKINGDRASVHVTINDEDYTYTLVKELGAWKVCFDFNDRY